MGYIDSFKLLDKVALVTGGSRGLGRAIAIGYGEVGAQVVVASRTRNLVEDTANEIIKKGGRAIAIPVDVRKSQDIEKMVSSVINTFGRIDILVNSAGVAPLNKAIDISVDEWDDVIETNLKATFLMCRSVGKVMIGQDKGKIINVGSVLGEMASNMALHYCASKAAIVQMTRALALEWSRFGINVNCIAPGFFDTEMTRRQQEDVSHRRFLEFKIPFKKLGKPEEIVGTAIFLASEASDYITGAVMVVDGGYSVW